MRLYFLRHGETDWNKERRMQGTIDIPLNEKGRRIAELTAKELSKIPFDLIISSPLSRAVETARIVTGHADIPLRIDVRLRELSWGEWEGLTQDDLKQMGYKEGLNLFFTDPFQFPCPPGGDSIQQVCERGKQFFEDVTHDPTLQDKTILVSTHGCALRGVLNHLYEDPMDFWQGKVPANCAVSIVDVDGETIRFAEKDKIYYDPKLADEFYRPE